MNVSELLKSSKRPLIHVGNGIRHCIPEFLAFIEKLQIPFVTARNANDICASDHPLYVGRPGTFAQRGANFAVQTCDLYIAIGTRLTLTQTGYNTKDYARNAIIVQVDVDKAELDKGTLRDPIKICADSRDFLNGLRDFQSDIQDVSEWRNRCRSWRERYPVVLPEYQQETGFVNSYHFIDVLSELCNEEDTIVTDMGFAFQVTHQTWKIKKGQRLLTNCGLAPMGWGLPAAVGAAFATGRRVLCITGEGGLQMNIQELATVQHHQLPIKIFVLNNGGYATIKQTQELGFGGRLMGVNKDTGLSFPDLKQLAVSYGHVRYQLYHSNKYMKENLYSALDWYPSEPVLCEVMLNPDQPQAPRALNRRNPDGTMNPTKLEDAHPFLDPETLAKEMEIE